MGPEKSPIIVFVKAPMVNIIFLCFFIFLCLSCLGSARCIFRRRKALPWKGPSGAPFRFRAYGVEGVGGLGFRGLGF